MMQRYVDKCFCRSLFVVLISSVITVLPLLVFAGTNEVDSLYNEWEVSKGSTPLLWYQFIDFDHNVAASEFIRKYQPGVVSLSNGDEKEVSDWILEMKNNQNLTPVFVCELHTVFEIPFRTDKKWPTYLEIQSIRDTKLVYNLGRLHGKELRGMGFDLVYVDSISNFGVTELEKVKSYFAGIRDVGLSFSLGSQAINLAERIGWNNVYLVDSGLCHFGQKVRKSRTYFRKQKQFDGLFVEEYQRQRNVNNKLNQIRDGAGLIRHTGAAELSAVNWLHSSVETKSYFKNAVKSYFKVKEDLANRKLEVKEQDVVDRDNLVEEINYQSKVLVKDEDSILPIGRFTEFLITVSNIKDENWRMLIDQQKVASHWSFDQLLKADFEEADNRPNEAIVVVDLAHVDQEQFMMLRNHLLRLQKSQQMILLSYGDKTYNADLLEFKEVIWSPVENIDARNELARIVLGLRAVNGRFPSYYGGGENLGIERKRTNRLDFSIENIEGIDYRKLSKIDSIVVESIANEEMPGCQIMVVKGGHLMYHKNFGFHTYDSLKSVQWNHLYDIASVTKTTALVPALMNEVKLKRVSIEDRLGTYLSVFDSTSKADLKLDKLLTHQSGLLSYYPFWRKAELDTLTMDYYYKNEVEKYQPLNELTPTNWEDSVNAWIVRSRFNRRINADSTFRYLYSDLGFILLQEIVEKSSGEELDKYVQKYFFGPLGMNYTMFNPIKKGSFETVPTENDQQLRKQLLDGQVHDKNAAIMGGVSGHAGLFSNATDLAKYMQMMLDDGRYGGEIYFNKGLVEDFTTKPYNSDRRALGWDKPNESISNCSMYASSASFGHSGFTGTLVWADPNYDLIYIFLSNRIHPDAKNYKLIKNNTRTRIHDVIYESFLTKDKFVETDM
ncbi:serine hydrolase domain-containing protein [Reichenbachiella versicolor]|uniref:serine hydrolase domain-containing protein n=1 Tax=Reichenbachiella versicolor TaxID=1821036 RepID=UPI000D6DF737|nr:serine hydrolase [Reichenbachiella versicolor]